MIHETSTMSKTASQVRAEFIARGETVTEWAKRNGFPVTSVRAVLSGHNEGRYGQSHRIAVALGMKEQPK